MLTTIKEVSVRPASAPKPKQFFNFRGQDRFTQYNDDELAMLAKDSNEALEFLVHKYQNFVRMKARSYFLIGADREDLVQEGLIGLYKAIRDYRDDKLASFRAFAELCITRQMITAIKTATRQKHIPLNQYVSLDKPIYTEGEVDRTLNDVIPAPDIDNPLDCLILKEEISSVKCSFDEVLSGLEIEVIKLYIEGKSYVEIAEELDRAVKSIDNALQRVKRKMELHLKSRQNIASLV